MKKKFIYFIPVKTVSEANSNEHWIKKATRHKIQKGHIAWTLHKEKPIFDPKNSVIRITRIAPRKLDAHDNLPTSLKYILDALAEYIFPGKAAGRADDYEFIKWEFSQERGKPKQYGVKIEIIEDGYQGD